MPVSVAAGQRKEKKGLFESAKGALGLFDLASKGSSLLEGKFNTPEDTTNEETDIDASESKDENPRSSFIARTSKANKYSYVG